MATTRICDRCGKSISWGDGTAWVSARRYTQSPGSPMTGRQYRMELEMHREGGIELIDLCQDCAEAMDEWIHGGVTNSAD